MEKLHYKGIGGHSVKQLELIIEQLTEELHFLKIAEKQNKNCSDKELREAYQDGFSDGYDKGCNQNY